MPEMRQREVSPSEVDLRLCVRCGTDFWGLGHPEGLCHSCRKPGAPRPPWNQTSPEKEKQP